MSVAVSVAELLKARIDVRIFRIGIVGSYSIFVVGSIFIIITSYIVEVCPLLEVYLSVEIYVEQNHQGNVLYYKYSMPLRNSIEKALIISLITFPGPPAVRPNRKHRVHRRIRTYGDGTWRGRIEKCCIIY
jgi:hypothetical protein